MNGSEPSDAIRAVNALLTQIDALKRFPNVMVLTTSNITEAIDLAFVDRADIKVSKKCSSCLGDTWACIPFATHPTPAAAAAAAPRLSPQLGAVPSLQCSICDTDTCFGSLLDCWQP